MKFLDVLRGHDLSRRKILDNLVLLSTIRGCVLRQRLHRSAPPFRWWIDKRSICDLIQLFVPPEDSLPLGQDAAVARVGLVAVEVCASRHTASLSCSTS